MSKFKLTFFPLFLGLIALVPDLARADVVPPATIAARSSARVYGQEKLVGRVQRVQGATIVMALDNGTTRTVALPDAAGGDFNFLVGKRIILTAVICPPPIVKPTPPAITQTIMPQRW
jgi:hypothetical protein